MSPKQSSADVSAPMSDSSGSNNMVILASSIVIASIILSITLFFTAGTVSTGMVSLAKAMEKSPGSPAAAAAAPSPSPSPSPTPSPTPTPTPAAVAANVDPAKLPVGGHLEGSDSAALVLTEYSDFQCPYCGRWVTQSYPAIKTGYVDTGKAKLVFKNFPLPFHPNAAPAANAAECAAEQGKFWQFHDKLFANQDSLSADNYKKWATDIGLNASQFGTCLDTQKFNSTVTSQEAEGSSFGVNGTPSFFISRADGGVLKTANLPVCNTDSQDQGNYHCIFADKKVIMVVGAQPSSTFTKDLDAELA